MPTKNTDKTVLKGNITAYVCRNETSSPSCSSAATLQLAPGADGAFTDTLPAPLASGAPRALTYAIELVNRKGRTAGLSNAVQVPAGQAPAPVTGLTVEMRRDGALLRWAPAPSDSDRVAIRFVRRQITPLNPPEQMPAPQNTTQERAGQGLLAPPREPAERTLLVSPITNADRALDADIRFGEIYEYRAQRVDRVELDGKTLELAGPLSSPVRIEAVNKLPPAVPKGLAAVATAGENGAGPAIDLNWQPNIEPDLAGYIVYRREAEAPGAEHAWQRISPAQPVAEPDYHDASVQPGHSYIYAVSAIDQEGHESGRSAEAQETVPAP
jgi:hypothetical protein